jgi:hypothetical protein
MIIFHCSNLRFKNKDFSPDQGNGIVIRIARDGFGGFAVPRRGLIRPPRIVLEWFFGRLRFPRNFRFRIVPLGRLGGVRMVRMPMIRIMMLPPIRMIDVSPSRGISFGIETPLCGRGGGRGGRGRSSLRHIGLFRLISSIGVSPGRFGGSLPRPFRIVRPIGIISTTRIVRIARIGRPLSSARFVSLPICPSQYGSFSGRRRCRRRRRRNLCPHPIFLST